MLGRGKMEGKTTPGGVGGGEGRPLGPNKGPSGVDVCRKFCPGGGKRISLAGHTGHS